MLYGGYVHVVDLQEVSWSSYYHNLATIQSLHVHGCMYVADDVAGVYKA